MRLRSSSDIRVASLPMSDATSDTRGIGAARRWIRDELASIEPKGRLEVYDESFQTPKGPRIDVPTELVNVMAVLPGRMPEAVNRRYYVVGHYDSRAGDQMDREIDSPGANDDASGVAVVIECARALAGDVKTSRELNLRLLPLHQRLFVEANPIPVKWALAQLGLIENGVRLPMTPLAERFHETVREALAEAGIALPLRVVEKRA